MRTLSKDPLNLMIAGVGGQGNVVMSLLIGNALVKQGYCVSVGDTFGASQRGGSVASHIRISDHTHYSSLIPSGHADIIVSLEPVEALRILGQFGNPDIVTITNVRPVYPPAVVSGLATYPDIDELLKAIKKLSARLETVNATDEAIKLGNPIFTNVIMMGALIGSGLLPLDKKSLEPILQEYFPKVFDLNMIAFNKGMELIGKGR